MAMNHDNMHIVKQYPHSVEVHDPVWITLRDGTRLAARIWRPEGADANPVPAILEYLPYRRNDMTRWRDSIRHPYLAGHGYACVRVDMRGNGDSDGIMLDEYTQQELDDCVEVLAWLEQQPWCTGKVGMFGKSWGGFNALQVAAMQPPQLKAIITIASTDDRYADDVHYMGGCLLASEMLSWASYMLLFNASPPDPAFVGDRWRDMWRERLEQTPPYVEAWVSHQRRDPFWQHGSVCEDYGAIQCAVYAVGGWADGYTNAVTRLLRSLRCPKKGLIGPWAHNFPENSSPTPAIGFLQEHLRWWDYWLKDVNTGIMDEPQLRTWIQDSFAPHTDRRKAPGRWVADEGWPSEQVEEHRVARRKRGEAQRGRENEHEGLRLVSRGVLGSNGLNGMDSAPWLAFGQAGEYPPDQNGDDGRSICFETDVRASDEVILGRPKLTLTLSADQPQVTLALRLCDVAPDGSSTLVTWGLANLSHRRGHTAPQPLPTGTLITVPLWLDLCGHHLRAGHRWRVAISQSYWPHLWPDPQPVTLTIDDATLTLPVRTAHAGDDALADFGRPECAPPIERDVLAPGSNFRHATYDRVRNMTTIETVQDSGTVRFLDGLEYMEWASDTYTYQLDDYQSAEARCHRKRGYARPDGWRVLIETDSRMTADAKNFYLWNKVTTWDGDELFFEQEWNKTVARDYQ